MSYGCEYYWTWHVHSYGVLLWGSRFHIAYINPYSRSYTAGVRGNRMINDGYHYWELRFINPFFTTVGVGTSRARLHADEITNLLGEDEHSWGLQTHSGRLWHGGQSTLYTEPFQIKPGREKTTVGILLNNYTGTLTYYRDGKCLGIAFTGFDNVREPLYPMVCSASMTTISLAHLRRELSLQEMCRSVIIKRVSSQIQVDKLPLPTRIKRYLCEPVEAWKNKTDNVNDNVCIIM
jgi:SPRY domain-containing SOCS box protein 3